MVALAVMMFLTAFDVTLRKLANMPIQGAYELDQFMLAITISLGLAYCAVEKGHVTIDLLTSRLSKRTQGIINSITGLLTLIFVAIMTWQTFIYITMLARSGLTSTVLLIPVFPFVIIVTFGIALFSLVLLVNFLEFLVEGMD
jgi:TRAP-type C4-dicarboxylate transport system permease small subunit